MADTVDFGAPSQTDLSFSSLFPRREPTFGAPEPVTQPWTAPSSLDLTPMQKARAGAKLIDGTMVSPDELAVDKYGAQLLAIRSRTDRYSFSDALLRGSWWDFVPFMGMFATAANELSAAHDASNAFQKLLRGEPLTRDEAIKATLWREEQEMIADGTWGSMFGSIVRQMPSFAAEMGAMGIVGGAARTSVAKGAVSAADDLIRAGAPLTDDAVSRVATYATTRAVKRGTLFEYVPMFVDDAIDSEVASGRFTTRAAAAASLRDDPVAIRKLTEQVAGGTMTLLEKSRPELTQFAGWAPGLKNAVANHLAERGVRAKLAMESMDSRWARWFSSVGQAMRDSAAEGLIDLGGWGSETATALTTTQTRASRAFAQAALDFTLFPLTRGAALFAPREAVSLAGGALVSAATGGKDPVRENTLSLQYEAWRQNNPDLMDKAETFGMVMDLLEYVSENTGRGFNSFMRGVGLTVAPKLIRPASKVAGLVEKTGSTKVLRDSVTGKVTDIVAPVGLVDAASSAEVGGILSRFVDKVFGARVLREGMAQDRFLAVSRKLEPVLKQLERSGVHVNEDALRSTIEKGAIDRALAPEIARAIGSDVSGFVEAAVKEAHAAKLFGMKTHAMFTYYTLDFLGRHNFDAQRVYEAFKTMGYDGIAAEMFEERYIDVVKELFGLDAKQAGFGERLATALQRLVWPEGGLKQLTAEACGFAVPAIARAGLARTLAAMGSPNDYAQHNAWSVSLGDVLKYGSMGTFHTGDYIKQTDEQIARLNEAAEKQKHKADTGEENGAPITELRRADLRASSERYREGALRAERLRRHFLATLGEDGKNGEFAAPVYSDALLTAGDFNFERHIQVTAEQARQAMVHYQNVIDFSGKVGQLQYKARHKTDEESAGWFRRAAHWAAEHAVRAAGFAATGEWAFLSANPAAFAAADRGVDKHLIDVLHDGYAVEYDKAVDELREGAADGVVSTDRAHEIALTRFQPKAKSLVSSFLAASQTLTFSHRELHDIALAKVAEEDGYIIDPDTRMLVKAETTPKSYEDYERDPGVSARIDAEVAEQAKNSYNILTMTVSERASPSVLAGTLDRTATSEGMLLRTIAHIPDNLPTKQLAVLAAALNYHPALSNVMVEKKIDPSRPITDQLPGVSNFTDVLKDVVKTAIGDAPLDTPEEVEAAIKNGIGKANDGTMEILGRNLGYDHDFTEKGRNDRDARILRYAIQTLAMDDPNRAVFSRPAPVAEDGERLGSTDDETVVAIYSGGKWSGQFLRVSTNRRVSVSAPTLDELKAAVADEDFGYAQRNRRIIHTPVRVLYGDSAYDFISALNLGKEYRDKMKDAFDETRDNNLRDPLLRRDIDEHGVDRGWKYKTVEEADARRRKEAALAREWEAYGRQGDRHLSRVSSGEPDITHWLRQGESANDKAARKRALDRMHDARDAWMARERRQSDGRPLGYNAIAETLVSGYGVRGSSHTSFENKFAVGDAVLRGRYSMSLSAYSRRLGADIYVSMDHGSAQSYSASLLRGAVNEALSRSFTYVNRMFKPYIEGFLVEVEKEVRRRMGEADELGKAMWQEFGEATVFGVGNKTRKASLATLSMFIEAFCLYRTEVDNRELPSTLGDFYAQLKAIAPAMRQSPAYLPFMTMADYVLGGSAFSRLMTGPDQSVMANRRGLAYYYALFSPNTPSMAEAIKRTLPEGKTVDDFIADIRQRAQAAFRPRPQAPGPRGRTGTSTPPSAPTPAPTPTPTPAPTPSPSPTPASTSTPTSAPASEATTSTPSPSVATPGVSFDNVINALNEELRKKTDGLTPLRAAQVAVLQAGKEAGVVPGEAESAVVASILGGNTSEAASVPSPEASTENSSPVEAGDIDVDTDDAEQQEADTEDLPDEEEDTGDDVYNSSGERFDVEPESVTRTLDADGQPVQADYTQLADLTEDEVNSFAATLAVIADAGQSGIKATRDQVLLLLARLAPDMDVAERTRVADRYYETGGRYVGDAEWVFDAKQDEEGLGVDGYDYNDTQNVEVIRSKYVQRLLAMISRVSPATGRDFQPFVEDLRAFITAAPNVLADQLEKNHVLKEAIDWLEKLLNPRANNDFDDACGRDAAYAELVSWMDPPAPGSGETPAKWTAVTAFVDALAGEYGENPPSAAAAVFVGYLMQQPPNVRRQLLQFISSSAPAQPVETTTDYVKGHTVFRTEEVKPRPGSTSLEAMTSALAKFIERPAAELEAAAERLEKAFRDEWDHVAAKDKAKLVLAFAGSKRYVQFKDYSGLFDVYARILVKEFGASNPLATAFMSRRLSVMIRTTQGPRTLPASVISTLSAFAYPSDSSDHIPPAVSELTSLMRAVATVSKSGYVDRKLLRKAVLGTFQSSAPVRRKLDFAPASVMGRGAWAMLIDTYSRAKPVSVMRAKNDETRVNKPTSSLAITMPGVEPVLQQFMDRKDKRGFLAFCKEYFPEAVARDDFDLGILRQRMEWPDLAGTGIVAHQIVKTAYANEVRLGNKAAYEDKNENMLYVVAFTGDHTSGFIFQAPIAKTLRERGVTYEQAEQMVAGMLGVDLFGVDAKRSMLTSLEAPGFSLIGIRHDKTGAVVTDKDGRPQTGVLRYSVLWNSEPGADNEAFKGTLGLYGYGARVARSMARDPSLSACKLHIAAVGSEQNGLTMPQITKSLVTAHSEGTAARHGNFLENTPTRLLTDYAESLAGSDPANSGLTTDRDSVKMTLINSKMLGVYVAGKLVSIMDYVFDTALRARIDSGAEIPAGSSVAGAEFDAMMSNALLGAYATENAERAKKGAKEIAVPKGGRDGMVPLVNLADGGKPFWVRLSEFVPGATITHTKVKGVYGFEYDVKNFMAFQVANVAHKAKATTKSVARNHLMDIGSVANVLQKHNADTVSFDYILPGTETTTSLIGDVIAKYGLLASAITSDGKSVDLALEEDDDWKVLLDSRIPTNGPLATELRRKVYSTWVNSTRTPGMRKIPAALVSSGAWADVKTGVARALPGTSKMFLDQQQGARTIAKDDRKFWRAYKRVSLTGVNSTDVTFRHGLFIDEKGLLEDEELRKYGVVTDEGDTVQRVVETLERIFAGIVSNCAGWSEGDTQENRDNWESWLRDRVGRYLIDHTGLSLSERWFWTTDRKTKKKTRKSFAQSVGYLDLFTRMTADAEGNFTFDRSAIYENMHDSKDETHLFLGGTKFAFTRTPSYNNHIEVSRAGLPVTTVETEGGWQCGADAYVMADPFSLKLLGNDNDGDKADLYMLDQRDGHLYQGDDGGLFCYDASNIDGIFREDMVGPIVSAVVDKQSFELARGLLADWRRWLVSEGILRREVLGENADGTKILGKLALSSRAKTRLSNTLVQGWFDLNMALPVYTDEGGVPYYAGTVVDGSRPGDMARGVKAAVSPESYKKGEAPDFIPEHTSDEASSWTALKAKEGVLSEQVLDINDPSRRIDNGNTAARVDTAAHLVSSARAKFVAASRNLTVMWVADAPAGLALTFHSDPQAYVDTIYHIDGPSNMSFDDMKEQICSRFGLWPGMVDTFLVEYMVLNGGLPVTDARANRALESYARKVNDPEHMYHYLLRASNPSDYAFHDMSLGASRAKAIERLVPSLRKHAIRLGIRKDADISDAIDSWLYPYFRRDDPTPEDRGLALYFSTCPDEKLDEMAAEYARWSAAVAGVASGNSIANALNYSYADPGDPDAEGKLLRNMEALKTRRSDSFGVAPAEDAPFLISAGTRAGAMFAATQLLLRGDGRFATYNRGKESASSFKDRFKRALRNLTQREGVPTAESMFLTAAAVCTKVNASRAITLANNARSVGRAAAAFLAAYQLKDSVFSEGPDGRVNMFRKCAMFAEAVSLARHAPRKRGRALSKEPPQVTANVTADFLWAVEAMVDILSRFVSLSSAHKVAPIADLFREQPAGEGYGFSEETYGPAVEGASRLSLGLPDMTRDQLVELQDMMENIVERHVLDIGGVEGSKPFASYAGKKPGEKPYRPAYDIHYVFSVENMKRMRKFYMSQDARFKHAASEKAVKAGTQRDLAKSLQTLIDVFEHLSKAYPQDFPAGFAIQPSALFGQLVPVYAALTDVVMNVPSRGTRSLSYANPLAFAAEEFLVGQMDESPYASQYLRMAEAIDWGLNPGYSWKEDSKFLKSLPSRSQLAVDTFNAIKKAGKIPTTGISEIISAITKPNKLSGFQARPLVNQKRPTLGVFDGARGVAFEALVNIMASYKDNPYADLAVSKLALLPQNVAVTTDEKAKENDSPLAQIDRQIDEELKAKKQFGGLDFSSLPVSGRRRSSTSTRKATSSTPDNVSPSTVVETRPTAPARSNKLEGYVNHSGGADQSDSEWGDVGAQYGVVSRHYYHKQKTPRGNVDISQIPGAYEEGLEHYKPAAVALGRAVSRRQFILDLMTRNWQQVKNADAVYAISRGFSQSGEHVLGGTGYAVQMAKAEGKPVHVFDQPSEKWYRWENGKWQEEPTPVLTKNFAGIGTHDHLVESGRQAIRDVYQATIDAMTSAEETGVSPDVVREFADQMNQVFRLWDGSEVRYDGKSDSFDIYARLVVDENDPNARAYKTRIHVKVTNGISGSREAYIASLAERTGIPAAELAKDPARVEKLAKEYKVAGLTTFRFDDKPGSFRIGLGDLDMLTADVTLDAAKALVSGSAFHEAFHAALGFARAAGVLTDEDIAVLHKRFRGGDAKYGKAWFNEESAAIEYQNVMAGRFHAFRSSEKTAEGVLQKLFQFFKTLVQTLGDLVTRHRSSDYANPIASNPITGLVFTGRVSTSVGEDTPEPKMMDRAARLYEAIKSEHLQNGGVMEGMAEETFSMEAEYLAVNLDFVNRVKRLAGVDKFADDKSAFAAIRMYAQQVYDENSDEYDSTLPDINAHIGTSPDESALLKNVHRAVDLLKKYGPVQTVVAPDGTRRMITSDEMEPGSARRTELKAELNHALPGESTTNFPDPAESVQILESDRTILSNGELAYWNERGFDKIPRILVASEHTDPVLFSKEVVDLIEGRTTMKLRNGTDTGLSGHDFAGLYIITKHDGLPIKSILETKIPKLIHFSITSLGGTEWEPNVMKYTDLLDRIAEYIQQGLDPRSITIRIDPVVPGVTKPKDVNEIMRRAKEMGITRVRFSVMDGYSHILPHLKRLGYDLQANGYTISGVDGYGRIERHATPETIRKVMTRMKEIADRHGITLGTCAEPYGVEGISREACLSVAAVNEMLGTSLDSSLIGHQRKECSCYGGKRDMLAWSKACPSDCAYCYARHQGAFKGKKNPIQYYGADGKLLDNQYTRTRPDVMAAGARTAVPVDANPVVQPDFVRQPVTADDLVAQLPVSEPPAGDVFDASSLFANLPVGSPDQFRDRMDVEPVLPRIRDAKARAGMPMQMAVPYGELDAEAALVGSLLRGDATDAQRELALDIVKRINRSLPAGDELSPYAARVRGAIERVEWLYGVKADESSKALGDKILRSLARLRYSTNGQSLNTGASGRPARSSATRASLAAAVAVTSGTTPADILEAALYDLRSIRDRRGSGNTLSDKVLDGHLIPALEALYARAADPTGLIEMFDPGNREGPTRSSPHQVFASLGAGLDELRNPDGTRLKFKVAKLGTSNNPYHKRNVELYADHEEDPDFQRAIGIALDATYMVAAARRMYMDFGFRPGTPDAELYAPGLLSPLEMAADLSATPEQYEDPSFSAVDSGWVVVGSQDDWLDSIMSPSFGSINLRDAVQGAHRAVAGFKWRSRSLNNLHAYEYGLSGNPGDALLAVDESYTGSGFGWAAGAIEKDRVHEFSETEAYEPGERVRHGGATWRAEVPVEKGAWDESKFSKVDEPPVRRYDNIGRSRAKDRNGKVIRMTREDMRIVDLVLKARLAWLSGARKLVTGVDNLTFHYEMSANPGDYTRDKVRARIDRGYANGETDFDKALNRIDIQLADSKGKEWFGWIVDSGSGKYGLRDSLVNAACDALKRAKKLVDDRVMAREAVNDYVIARLNAAGLVNGVQRYSQEFKSPVYVSAAVALDPDKLERMFLDSAAYGKLIAAGRKAEWLTREAYLRPYSDLVRDMRMFARSNAFVGQGAARFLQGVTSPVPFAGGDGITIYGLSRAAEVDSAEVAAEVRTSFADAFSNNVHNADGILKAPPEVVLMARAVFHLPQSDVETTRRRLARGDFSDVRGLEGIGESSSVSDLVASVAQRLDDMVFNRSMGRRDAELFGGINIVKSLVKEYRESAYDANAPVPNVAGLAPDIVHRMTGRLPANFQAGHAVVNMVDGLANALAYRATLVNMVTTPDADGMPLCFAKPALDAEATTGVPDAVWGEVARWWGKLYGLEYDGLKTGVENARAMYDEIVEGGKIDKSQFGSINPEDMDDRTIEGFWARKGVPEGESNLAHLAGGYALGYAKHLFRSTKGLGAKWQRETIHRAWAYSKAMSVSFSLFFPLATRFESPVGAVGLMATLGGNISPDSIRKHADAINKIFNVLGPAWITKSFTGERDFAQMLDSNDPFLTEMYEYAAALGLTLSTADVNPEENARGILRKDLADLVSFVRAKFGDAAAKRVADISDALLLRASDKAFTYHLNATKLAVAAQMCMKLRADAAERGIAFDPVRDMRRYTAYINAEIGGIDPLQYTWAHPGMQNFLNTLFFSWQWTRGAWEAGGGKVIEQVLFGGHDITPEERKYLIGRAIRMYGWIAFGLPTALQLIIKAIGWAIDPDHEDKDEEKWWIWDNEDKAYMKAFNLTPIMRAIAKRFPKYAEWRGEHPFLAGIPNAAFMLTKSPWFVPAALPVYTGTDARNTTYARPYYMHFGKQVWEFNRWFDQPVAQFVSKLAMPIQRITEGVLGRSLAWQDHAYPWANKGDFERWLAPTKDSAIVNLGKAFMPFSFTGLFDLGDAGLLPTLGPVTMGKGGQETLKDLKADLEAWVTNDRRAYTIRRHALKRAKSEAQSLRRFRARVGENPVVWRHVESLLASGYSEAQARHMVDRAIGDLRSERYRKLQSLLPKRPDDDYDVKEWSKTVRELQKLGLTARSAYKALIDRLERSDAWQAYATAEMRAKYREMIWQAAMPPEGERSY